MKLLSPAAKPMRSPGRLERFDSEWKMATLAKSAPGSFEHAVRRALAVDLAIALVGENQKAETPRQRGELFEVSAIGHRALRIRRRGDIERDGAREQLVVERIEVRQEAGLARGRQIHRLAIGADRAGGISGVKRIGNEHRRPASARLNPILGGECREKQSLARAVEHQHFVCRIDRARQLVAAAEPSGDGNAEFIEALVRGVAAEFRHVRIR